MQFWRGPGKSCLAALTGPATMTIDHSDKRRKRKFLFAGIAFFLQGGWALYANHRFGMTVAWQVAFLHGGMCTGQTLVSGTLMEWLFGISQQIWVKLALPVFGTTAVIVSLLIGVHCLNHTPDIVRTIAPVLLLAVPYYAFYTILLWRDERHSPDEKAPQQSNIN